jgi:hypothetical protein
LTIKQFIYLVIFIPLGLAVYTVFPIPILNILLGAIVALIGVAFAFVPINDRPMEVWIRNLIKRLTSPTQYRFEKHNLPIYFLKNLVFNGDPHRVSTHIDSQQKLAKYLNSKTSANGQGKKQAINELLINPLLLLTKKPSPVNTPSPTLQQSSSTGNPSLSNAKSFFLTGIVKNHRQTPLVGVLVYVKKDQSGEPIRIFRTNQHGIFTTYNSLPVGEYFFEVKDTKGGFFFDTMKIKVENINKKPIEIVSRELI